MSDEETFFYIPLMPEEGQTVGDLIWQMAYDISESDRLFSTMKEALAKNTHGGPIVKIVASFVTDDRGDMNDTASH